jgi:hypothetical protein
MDTSAGAVGLAVAVGVGVGLAVEVGVGVGFAVEVGAAVDVGVRVAVEEGVGVSVAWSTRAPCDVREARAPFVCNKAIPSMTSTTIGMANQKRRPKARNRLIFMLVPPF